MRRQFLLATVGLLSIVRAPLHADNLILDVFGKYIESLRAQTGIPGLSGALVGLDGIIWEQAFGYQDVEQSIAARPDTPYHVDGLTEMFTASLALRCVEEGRLSLDDRIGRFDSASPDANATLRQVLTHTSGTPDNLVFAHRPERLAPLASAIRTCTGDSFRESTTDLLDRLAMTDSVPGPDVIRLTPPAEGIPSPAARERYTGLLARLARSYAVDRQGRPSPSSPAATTLTPTAGLIATARDVAKFDVAMRNGVLLRRDTLAAAWRAPLGPGDRRLPHGMGWFVQTYNGETVVWQFGLGENASSSLIMTLPARELTLILLANGDGLVKGFAPAAGDVTASPFARLFLGTFVR